MKRLWSGAAGVLLVCVLVLSAPALAKVLKGTRGDDKLVGTKTGDKLIGRGGDDILRSRLGSDLVLGKGGSDFIKSGKGFDEIRGGGGDDEIHARDGKPDQINCGAGKDRVLVDRVEDGVYNCERVRE